MKSKSIKFLYLIMTGLIFTLSSCSPPEHSEKQMISEVKFENPYKALTYCLLKLIYTASFVSNERGLLEQYERILDKDPNNGMSEEARKKIIDNLISEFENLDIRNQKTLLGKEIRTDIQDRLLQAESQEEITSVLIELVEIFNRLSPKDKKSITECLGHKKELEGCYVYKEGTLYIVNIAAELKSIPVTSGYSK